MTRNDHVDRRYPACHLDHGGHRLIAIPTGRHDHTRPVPALGHVGRNTSATGWDVQVDCLDPSVRQHFSKDLGRDDRHVRSPGDRGEPGPQLASGAPVHNGGGVSVDHQPPMGESCVHQADENQRQWWRHGEDDAWSSTGQQGNREDSLDQVA